MLYIFEPAKRNRKKGIGRAVNRTTSRRDSAARWLQARTITRSGSYRCIRFPFAIERLSLDRSLAFGCPAVRSNPRTVAHPSINLDRWRRSEGRGWFAIPARGTGGRVRLPVSRRKRGQTGSRCRRGLHACLPERRGGAARA